MTSTKSFKQSIPKTVESQINEAKLLYDRTSSKISSLITKSYSTSFSLGILCLDRSIRAAIYNIYGFVRVADEIVDTFHDYDKKTLLDEFEEETYKSITRGISTNPVLNSFQEVVNTYHIDISLIESFLQSMRMDLDSRDYDAKAYDTYIHGSAEAVGLMCLYVFVDGNQEKYEDLKAEAMKLGSAFQKINFLRDINADAMDLGRMYFPGLNLAHFDDDIKQRLLDEIDIEFELALYGIRKLPKCAKLGVYIAYKYYRALAKKVRKMPAQKLLKQRARISNYHKIYLLLESFILNKFGFSI